VVLDHGKNLRSEITILSFRHHLVLQD